MILISVTSCGRNTQGISDYCVIYQPVYTVAADTEDTKLQVDENNAAYESNCNKGS